MRLARLRIAGQVPEQFCRPLSVAQGFRVVPRFEGRQSGDQLASGFNSDGEVVYFAR
jgi:hypothetical protein